MENEQDELRHRHMQDQHPHQRVSIGYSDVMLHVDTREARKWSAEKCCPHFIIIYIYIYFNIAIPFPFQNAHHTLFTLSSVKIRSRITTC